MDQLSGQGINLREEAVHTELDNTLQVVVDSSGS